MSAGTCTRCVRLFVKREHTDPRMRKQQLDLDRRRERRAQVRLAAGALIVPGSADSSRAAGCAAWSRCSRSDSALGLLRAPELLPLPWELGGLGGSAPYAAGLALLAPLYALGARAGARHGSRP